MLHADEAVFAGKPQVIARLKSMITSRVTMREGKYANAGSFDNDLRLLITSNEHRVVPAAFEERRFAVLEVGTGRQNDHGFFGAVYRELEEGGLGRLLHLLQTFPLSTVNLRQIPKTAALRDQKLASLSAIDAWWFERLRAGVNRRGRGSWQDVVTYDDQYETYLDPVGGARASDRKSDMTRIGTALQRLAPGHDKRRMSKAEAAGYGGGGVLGLGGAERPRAYELPPLAACRKAFEDLIGHKLDWDEGEEEEEDAAKAA